MSIQTSPVRLRKPHVKRAAIGDAGTSSFEASFSNLAHAHLRERAPQLLEHELGFQLLEKNDDNDRAVGIFGFQIGNQLMYAPVFFLNGELKGFQLLYLKDSDTFVPLKENWINYILNRRPAVLGSEVGSDLRRIGVNRPTFEGLRDTPASKYGSDHPPWVQAGLPGLMHALVNWQPPPLALPGLLEKSASAALSFVQWLSAFPTLVGTFADCYGADMLKTALDVARTTQTVCPVGGAWRKTDHGQMVKKAAKPLPAASALRIWVDTGTPECRVGLTEKQAEQLKRDGVFIDDKRADASIAFKVQEPLALKTPDETGMYDVLCHPNTFDKCVYIHGTYGRRSPRSDGVLIRVGDGTPMAWVTCHPANIFTSKQYAQKEYRSWFDDLPEAGELEVGARYALVAPNGQGTNVFEVEATEPSQGEERCYKVWWQHDYSYSRPDFLPPLRTYDGSEGQYDDPVERIVLRRIKGDKFVARRCELLVPPGAKAVKVKDPPKKDDKSKDTCCVSCCSDDSSDPPPLRPGDHVDLQLGIIKMSSELRVLNDGIEAYVNDRRMPPKAALIHLVRDLGLREPAARALLKEAQQRRGVRCRIKLAQPFDQYGMQFSAPPIPDQTYGTDSIMGSGVPAANDMLEEMPIAGLEGQPPPDMAAPPATVANQLSQAAQTGQREVLDATALSNLLRGSQDNTLIDKHIVQLLKGLDSLSRLIFNLYWHNNKFEERYGAENLPELEDAMINAHESLGDITLELKQKTVDPFPEEGVDTSIGEGEGE